MGYLRSLKSVNGQIRLTTSGILTAATMHATEAQLFAHTITLCMIVKRGTSKFPISAFALGPVDKGIHKSPPL